MEAETRQTLVGALLLLTWQWNGQSFWQSTVGL